MGESGGISKAGSGGVMQGKSHFSMGSKDLNYAKRKCFSLPVRGEFVQCRMLWVSSKTWHISFEIQRIKTNVNTLLCEIWFLHISIWIVLSPSCVTLRKFPFLWSSLGETSRNLGSRKSQKPVKIRAHTYKPCTIKEPTKKTPKAAKSRHEFPFMDGSS